MSKEIQLRKIPQEMRERMKRALNEIWQAIGPDVLRAYAEEGESAELPRSQVIDIVLDMGYQSTYTHDKEALCVLYELTWNARQKIAKEAFPYRRYGW